MSFWVDREMSSSHGSALLHGFEGILWQMTGSIKKLLFLMGLRTSTPFFYSEPSDNSRCLQADLLSNIRLAHEQLPCYQVRRFLNQCGINLQGYQSVEPFIGKSIGLQSDEATFRTTNTLFKEPTFANSKLKTRIF